MALINCPECGRQISDRAPSCPGCGILKEDIQEMLAEQNSNAQETKNNNVDVSKTQGIEEEFFCYPTVSVISEREKKQYSEKNETKSLKVEQTVKTGRAEERFNEGDIVTFGTQEEKPIRWIVLKTYGDDMLLFQKSVSKSGGINRSINQLHGKRVIYEDI